MQKESPPSGSIIIGNKPLLSWGRHRRKGNAIRSIIIIIANWIFGKKLLWYCIQYKTISVQESELENIVCKMANILSRPQCVDKGVQWL